MPKFLPFMLLVSAVLAVLAAVAGFVIAGSAAALGAAAGVAFIAVLYALSTVFITWVESFSRELMLVAALLSYVGKLAALLITLNALGSAGWDGVRAMVFGVAAAALVWIVAQMWWLTHAKIPYVDLGERK